jgi:predicted RNA binding protein YcfA (HicA-like mRNA interferase family)
MTTREMMAELEALGFQFLKDKGGWACYDGDTRLEVPRTRHPHLGDSIHMAKHELGL